MFITGLQNIKDRLEDERLDNLRAWYEHNTPPGRRDGTRRDVWINIKVRDAQKRHIKELEEEIHQMKKEKQREWASHQMHMAMGCDDRDCRECR